MVGWLLICVTRCWIYVVVVDGWLHTRIAVVPFGYTLGPRLLPTVGLFTLRLFGSLFTFTLPRLLVGYTLGLLFVVLVTVGYICGCSVIARLRVTFAGSFFFFLRFVTLPFTVRYGLPYQLFGCWILCRLLVI